MIFAVSGSELSYQRISLACVQWRFYGGAWRGHGGAMPPPVFSLAPGCPPHTPSFVGSMEFWEMTTCYSNRLRTLWAFAFLLPWYEWELSSCASVIVRQQSLHPPMPEVSVLWRKAESKSGRQSIADDSVHTCFHAADRMVSASGQDGDRMVSARLAMRTGWLVPGLPLGTTEPQGLVQILERSRCSYAWISCQRNWHEIKGDEKLSFFSASAT